MKALLASILLLILLSNFFHCCVQEPNIIVVSRAVDGDTLELENGEFVRLLGINTPEKGQPFYEEAKIELKGLVEGKKIRLEEDGVDRDVYGRLLRYVFVNEFFVNAEMVRRGYSKSLNGPSSKYYIEFKTAERIAKAERLGIWK